MLKQSNRIISEFLLILLIFHYRKSEMLVFLLITISVGNCCQDQMTSLSYFGCQVSTTTCQNFFYMSQCKQQYCVEGGVRHNYTLWGQCDGERGYYSYDNETCMEKCCGDVAKEIQFWNSETSATCYAENERLYQINDILLVLILIPIVLGIVILMVIHRYIRQHPQIYNSSNNNNINQGQQSYTRNNRHQEQVEPSNMDQGNQQRLETYYVSVENKKAEDIVKEQINDIQK